MLKSLLAAAVSLVPVAVVAQPYGAWHYEYQMGIATYSLGADAPRSPAWFSLQCSQDGEAMLLTKIGGVAPPGGSKLVVSTGTRVHHFLTGPDGAVTFAGKAHPLLAELWTDLGRSDRVTIAFAGGAMRTLPSTGAHRTLGPKPCPA